MDAFYEDVFRIIRSTSFRRLAHKTQVFINDAEKVDHYRSRLTHTIETAAIGRAIAKNLGLNSDLTEAICLAHDIGHPPFGHAGEDVLNELLQDHGGFNHNYYAFKLVTQLETKYIGYDGLNLTWETLEGMIKHNGPMRDALYPKFIEDYNNKHDMQLDKCPSLEAQAAAIADDIAYTSHDMEDGLREGLITIDQLLQQDFMQAIPVQWQNMMNDDEKRTGCEIMFALTEFLIDDVVQNSNASASGIANFLDIQDRFDFVVAPSRNTRAILTQAKSFLMTNVYTTHRILEIRNHYKQMVKDVFNACMNNPSLLPASWSAKQEVLPVVVGDYIAGMTDKFVINMHKTLNNRVTSSTLLAE